jgi:hypothetical protein
MGEREGSCRIFVGELEIKGLYYRPSNGLECNVRTDMKEMLLFFDIQRTVRRDIFL